MADQVERVILEAEDDVTPIVNRANASLLSHEKQAESSHGKIIRITDQSRSSVQRLIASQEKLAEVYGKTGVERLIAQKDQLLQRWAKEPAAVDAITKSYEKMIAEQKKIDSEAKFEGFGEKVKQFIESPLQSVRGLLTGMGGWVAAGVAALGAVASVGFEAAKSLAEYGLQIKNVELRTGLTSKEIGQFGFAARMAGQDTSIFERMMKGLVTASEEGGGKVSKASEALQRMGIDLRGVTGEMKPTSQLLLEISEGLGKLPEGVQRDAAAMDLFKKVGVEAIPVISGLAENVKRAKELGLGATEEDLRRWEQYHQKVTEAEILWERFTRKIKEPLAAVVTVMFADKSGHEYTIEDLQKRGVNFGKYAPHTREDDRAAAKAAGWSNPEAERWERNIAQSSLMSYIDKVYARQKGDAAVKSFESSQGLAGQLKKAEEALSVMTKPAIGVSSVRDVGDYAAAEKRVQGLKDQIAAGKQNAERLKEFQRQAAEFEKKGDESELGAIAKIYYQRDLLLAQAGKLRDVEADSAGIRKSADKQASVIFNADQAKFEEFARKQQDERARKMSLAMGPSKEQMKEWEEGFVAQDRIEGINLTSRKETLNREAGQAQKMVGLSGLTGMAAIRATYQIRIDLAKQLAAVEAERISKEENAALKSVEMATAQAAVQKEMAEAQEEAIMRQREFQKQQMEDLKKDTEGLWHTLFTKPQDFGRQLGSTVRGSVLHPIIEGLGNVTANLLQPLIAGMSGMFHGMFGGGAPIDRLYREPLPVVIMNGGDGGDRVPTGSTVAPGMPGSSLPTFGGGSLALASLGAVLSGGGGGFSLPSISTGWGIPDTVATGSTGGGFAGGDYSSGGSGRGLFARLFGGGQTAHNPSGGAGFGGWFSTLRSNFWNGDLTNKAGGYAWQNAGTLKGDLAGVLTSKGAAGLYMAGGVPLAMAGITGSRRGTWGGIAESTGGGALLGAGIGTMILPGIGTAIGAGIGALAGFGIGLGEKLFGVESQQTEAQRLIRNIYGIDIPKDSGTIKQIIEMSRQYGNSVSMTIRTPEARKLIELYAQSTGQKSNLFLQDPMAAHLQERNGSLYQSLTYNNGTGYTFGSQAGIPTLGNGATIPTSNPYAGGAGMSIKLDGPATTALLRGEVTQVASSGYIAAQSLTALEASKGRLGMAASLLSPSVIAA